ncbi:YigZ family protein [Streptococcus marmotae]|uniref:YigZ family protein n=1 Tax=Streptococcus marmotae TaxID=1825069 RepID=UPI000830F95F|nr:YigZ family protein [Streptococcus marmotae]
MKEYRTITADGLTEEEIKKSRFICHLKRVKTEDEARDFINYIKKEHYRATHNCSAFILGEQMEIKRSSDDGEPSGTAGVPMLTVLENNHLTNVVAVVTRYFGGVKLGAGGLIRAYAGAVAHGLAEIGMVVVKEQQGIAITMSYSQYQEFANWRATHDLEEYDTAFLADIQTMIFVDKENTQNIIDSLTEFYHGKVQVKTAEFRVVEVPVHCVSGFL